MSTPRKHPLEVFRESGQRFGAKRSAGTPPTDTPGEPVSPGPSERRPRPEREFEVRLSLVGALVLLFVWMVLVAGSYLYGFHRGEQSANEARDTAAWDLGGRIESGQDTGGDAPGDSPAARAPHGYGILVTTYPRWDGKHEGYFKDLRSHLRSRYGIDARLVPFQETAGPRIEVFLGRFSSAEDPNLQALLGRLRSIRDYPAGDSAPFKDARIRPLPDDPDKTSRGANPGEDR